ncbi:MAG: hypothetical protein FJ197_06110 [Gammaproteobacteria bacterium]|nr:hypothetical protein [Gammaproteobacteria bacterium]
MKATARLQAATAIVVLAVLAVLPSISGEAIWDDVFWSRQIEYFKSAGDVLRPPAGIPDWPSGYFRPVTTASYLLDRVTWGEDWVRGRHVSNIAFHALASLALWGLARRLLADLPQREFGALAAGALFAVHPIHTESVCWIGARVDVLATLFLTVSLTLSLAWRDSRSVLALLAGGASFLLALGSKEVAVAGLAILPVLLVLAPRGASRGSGDWLAPAAGYAAAATLYFVLRADATTSVAGQFGGLDIARLAQASAYYIGKLVWPWPQSNFVVPGDLPGLAAAAGIFAAGSVLLALAIRAWRNGGSAAPLAGLLWTGAALTPSLVVALSGFATNPVAERYLYLPSAGFALACGAGLAWTASRLPIVPVRAVAGLIVAALLAASVSRSVDWSSNIRLWSSTTALGTTHAQPWVELATAQMAAGEYPQALAAFDEARRRVIDDGTLSVAEYNTGLVHLKLGDPAQAELAFTRARNADPAYALARYGLGRAYYEQALLLPAGRSRLALFERAENAFLAAIGLNAGFGEPRLELVKVALRRGQSLAADGDAAGAARGYASARTRLDALLAALPSLATAPGIPELSAEIDAAARGSVPRTPLGAGDAP